jgi:hypothetical protein
MNWLDLILYPSSLDQLVKYISISNGPAGQNIIPFPMDQPESILYHPIWTGWTGYCTILYGPACQIYFNLWWTGRTEHNTIPYGPAGVHIIPSYMNRLDRILYHPIWTGRTGHNTIPYGPAGVHIIPSYMNRLDRILYHPIWTSWSNIFQSLMDRPDRT